MKLALSSMLIIVLNIMAVKRLYSQTYKGGSNISISYGFISGKQISDELSGGSSGSVADYTTETGQTGSVFLSYRYFFAARSAIGITIGTQTISGTYYLNNVLPDNVDNFTLQNTTIAAEYLYVYKNTSNFQWYTIFGAGASIYNRQDNILNKLQRAGYYLEPANGAKFNFQYTPIAISLGPKFSIFSIFMEFGIGYKGIFNFGLNCKFGKNKKLKEKSLLK